MMRITIVTSVLNGKKYIEETLLSVLRQDYPDLEYIVQDGGSTDGTIEIIKKYERELAFWESRADNSMYEGIDAGFARSTGQIMGWLNADDILFPDGLEKISRLFGEFPAVDWVTGLRSVVDGSGEVLRSSMPIRYNKVNFLRGRTNIQQESTFWRRELWDKTGAMFPSQYRLAGDLDLWARFFSDANLYRVDECLGAFRRHGDQITQNQKFQYEQERDQIRRSHRRDIKWYWMKTFYDYVLSKTVRKADVYVPDITYNAEIGRFVFCKVG